MSHRVSRKTFRRFELRQRRDLARFKAEVLDAVARMTPPDGEVGDLEIVKTWSDGTTERSVLPGAVVFDTRTFGNGEADT